MSRVTKEAKNAHRSAAFLDLAVWLHCRSRRSFKCEIAETDFLCCNLLREYRHALLPKNYLGNERANLKSGGYP